MKMSTVIIIMAALLIGGTLLGYFHEPGAGFNQSFLFWLGAAFILPCLAFGAYLFYRGMKNWIQDWKS